MAALQTLIGHIIDEKYRIEKQLGQGGMGAVFLATHLGTTRPVAIKVIAPQFMANEEFVARFRREAEAAGRLRHPNVVNVTDFGFTSFGQGYIAFLVMEYLDGLTLGELLERRGKLPLELVGDIIEQICLAIEKAHKLGIIHRDLKPDNIWLEPNGRGGYNVKVLDFGLAKLHESFLDSAPALLKSPDGSLSTNLAATNITNISAITAVQPPAENQHSEAVTQPQLINMESEAATVVQLAIDSENNAGLDDSDTGLTTGKKMRNTNLLTRVGSILGTPLYMSPEQCRGDKLTASTDIYSLGVIAYQMLLGETPFNGDVNKLMRDHMENMPRSLREKRRDIPKAIDALIMSALAKDPAERPLSALAFATTLRANIAGEIALFNRASNVQRKLRGTFIRSSILVYILPVLLGYLLVIIKTKLYLLSLPLLLTAASLNTAFCALILEKYQSDPVKSPKLRTLLPVFIKRLPALLFTLLLNVFDLIFGLINVFKPGWRNYFSNLLGNIIIVIEYKQGMTALQRSKRLLSRLPQSAIFLQAHQLLSSIVIFVSPILLAYFINDSLPATSDNYQEVFTSHDPFVWMFISYSMIFQISLAIVTTQYSIAEVLLYKLARIAAGEELSETDSNNVDQVEYNAPTGHFLKRLLGQLAILVFKRAAVFLTVLITFVLVLVFIVYKTRKTNEELVNAATKGQVNKVQEYIAKGANVNLKGGPFDSTPLVTAAGNGHVEIMKLLLIAGADVNLKGEFGNTPLTLAAQQGRVEAVKLLLSVHADSSAKNDRGKTAYQLAEENNYPEIIELLK